MKRWVRLIGTSFIGGVLFMLPVIVIVFLGQKGWEILQKISQPLLRLFPDREIPGIALATLVEIFVFSSICIMAGWVSQTRTGRRFFTRMEGAFLHYLPGYTFIRSALYQMSGHAAEANIPVVLAAIEDEAWQIAILVETLDSGLLAVYVPGAPSFGSGNLYFLRPERVKRTSLPLWKAHTLLRRLGVGSAKTLKSII